MPLNYEFLVTGLDGKTYVFEGFENVLGKNTTLHKSKWAIPDIRHVVFNRDTGHTVVVWADGEKTVVHCMEGEKFEPYAGFAMAVCKRLFGSTSAGKKVMNDHEFEAVTKKKNDEHMKKIIEQRELEEHNHRRKIHSLVKRLRNLDEALGEMFADSDKDDSRSNDIELLTNLIDKINSWEGGSRNG